VQDKVDPVLRCRRLTNSASVRDRAVEVGLITGVTLCPQAGILAFTQAVAQDREDELMSDTLPSFTESAPRPPQLDVPLVGAVLQAAQELKPLLRNASSEADVVYAALAVLHQAKGRKIQFVDTTGYVTELNGIWR